MPTKEELLVEIRGDNRQFRRSVDQAVGDVDNMTKRTSGAFRAMGGAALRAGAVVSAFGAGVVGKGVAIASEMEQASIGFTTLLGSAERADEFMRELLDFAARTPFEFAGVRDAAQKFLAMGFAAEEVKPLLTAVGDAVAAMGGGQDEIGGITRALTQMQAKGKVTAEEMLQLAERGIPAWEMLAEAMGVSVSEAMDEVSRGSVQAGTFIEAFMTGTAERFGGAMEAQSQSLAGLFSTLKDTISLELAEASAPLVEALKGNLPLISETLGGVIKNVLPPLVGGLGSLLPVLNAIAPLLGRVAALFGQAFSALSPIAAEVVEAFTEIFDALLPIAEEILPDLAVVLGVVAPTLGIVASILNFLSPVLPFLSEGILAVVFGLKLWAGAQAVLNLILAANPIGLVIVAVGALVGAIIALVKHWDTVSAAVRDAFDKVKVIVADAVGWLLGVFLRFHPVGIFIRNFDRIKTALRDWGERLKTIGGDVIQGLWDGLTARFELLVNWWKGAWSGIIDWVKDLLGIASPSRVFMEIGQQIGQGAQIGIEHSFPDAGRFIGSFVDGGRQAARSGPVSTGGRGDVVIHQTINGPVDAGTLERSNRQLLRDLKWARVTEG